MRCVSSLEVSLIRNLELHFVGRVSVRQSLPTGKGNFQAGMRLSRSFPIVVTRTQGKVVTISEARDQQGGELTFENGETLSYEGVSSPPPRLPASSFRTNTVLAVCVGSHWPGPLNFPSSEGKLGEFVGEWRSKFKQAKDILLVGAGAVGLGKTSYIFPRPSVDHS